MAKNTGFRRGAVDGCSQFQAPNGNWVKRDTETDSWIKRPMVTLKVCAKKDRLFLPGYQDKNHFTWKNGENMDFSKGWHRFWSERSLTPEHYLVRPGQRS